jgi:hypothetical protein
VADLLRSMLTAFINTLMSADAEAVCDAAYGEPSTEWGRSSCLRRRVAQLGAGAVFRG